MSVSDTAMNIARAAVAAVPGGGVILELIGDVVPSSYDRANEMAVDLVRERVAALHEHMDENLVNRVEFVDLFKICDSVIERTQHEEKLRAAANIISNALLREGEAEKLSYAELDHFARALDQLSLPAIQVLRDAVATQQGTGLIVTDAIARHVGVSDDLMIGLLRQLEACDFVIISFGNMRAFGRDTHTVKVRPAADRFIRYVLDANSQLNAAQPGQ